MIAGGPCYVQPGSHGWCILPPQPQRTIDIAPDHQDGTPRPANETTLGAVIRVKDDVELLRRSLAFHRAAGVDFFVLCTNGSSARSLAILEDLADRSSHVDLFRQDLYRSADIDLQVMKRARLAAFERMTEVFSPEWTFVPDADELWVARSGDLKSALRGARADHLTVARRNAALARGARPPILGAAIDPAEIRRQEIIARPTTLSSQALEQHPEVPWIFHSVGGKFITRATDVTEILPGFHDLRARETLRRARAEELLILHFPFTTLERFAKKIDDMRYHLGQIRHTLAGEQAWTWRHWVRNVTDAASLRAEFDRQFFDREKLADLRRRGIVESVERHFAAIASERPSLLAFEEDDDLGRS